MNNVSLVKNSNMQVSSPTFEKRNSRYVSEPSTPEEKIQQVYRSQGFLGKAFDGIQGLLGIGMSRKKLQRQIKTLKPEQVEKNINKYYDQQKNETEIAVDLMTGLFAATTFKFLKKMQSYSHLFVKSPKFELMSSLFGVGIGAVVGMTTKPFLKSLNSLGTPKRERRKERTILKDMGSGLIDGAAAPVAYAYKLGLLGAVGINSASRYAFNKKADKDGGISNHISDGWAIKLPALGIAVFSALKFHKKIDRIENAIVKSKENIKNAKDFKGTMPLSEIVDLTKYNIQDKQTRKDLIHTVRMGFFGNTYKKFTSTVRKLLGRTEPNTALEICEIASKPTKRVLFANKELIKEKEMTNIMKELEQYNIFYPKMLQVLPSNVQDIFHLFSKDGSNIIEKIIESSSEQVKEKNIIKRAIKNFTKKRAKYVAKNGVETLNNFINNYKNNCPASRTVSEAQKYIEETFGSRFKIQGTKPLGVGTVAETFAAKDNETGKDVVIKMVKKWVTPEKLQKDKENILKSIERVKHKMKPGDYDFQCKVVDELYKAWSKELDMQLEADAAVTLGKYAVNYNTVAPVAVKNNIFVMDKANGVEFDKFVEYLDKNNIKLTKDELSDLTIKYFKVFFEQLLSVPKKGDKVMHADPHAGNIFIDLKNKEKPFTFIDTGNVMRFTPEEAIQNVTSHIDYLIGNSKSISKRLLKDAVLPEGMTQKEAEEMLSKHLDETFFSGKNRMISETNICDPFSTINNESMDFMKKNKVILNSKNTNLLKAEITYFANIISLSGLQKHVDKNSTFSNIEQSEQLKLMGKQIYESILNAALNNRKCTYKEITSRMKYIEKNPEQFFTTLYSYIPPELIENSAKNSIK